MQYIILDGQSADVNEALEKLKREVIRYCNSGWRPQGGVSVAVTRYDYVYACQAMVREE